MKPSLLFLCAVLSSLILSAQNDQFRKGQTDIQFGIGFISTLSHDFKNSGFDTKSTIPPVSGSVDFAVSDEISVGGMLAYAKTHLAYEDMDLGNVSHIVVGVRALYHFDLTPALDTYGGAMLGYHGTKVSDESADSKASAFAYTVLVGGRYRFSQNAGLFLEIGYGVSSVTLGLNFRL